MSREADRRRAEALAGIIGKLGDKCLELDAQRRWLLEALEGHSAALCAVLALIEEHDELDDELRLDVIRRVGSIMEERVDFSDETIDRLFPQREPSS